MYPKIAEDQPIFCCDISDLCNSNYERYLAAEKYDIAKAWSLIKISLGEINCDLLKLSNWATNPMGKGLVIKLLLNFQQQGDIQNLALLASLVLGSETKILENIFEARNIPKLD